MDLKHTLTSKSNCDTRNFMEEAKLCFYDIKSFLTSAHDPKGKKGGQGSVDGIFIAFPITI